MKNKTKITILSVVVAILTISLAGLLYLTFIKDSKLKAMGYTYDEIKLLHQYDLAEKVDHYHQSLLYALTSKDFQQKNLDYYLFLESQMDYTSIINQLADKYDLQQCQTLLQFLDVQDIIELDDYDKIENLTDFKTLINNGYTLFSAVTLTNSVDSETIRLFTAELNQQKADNYISYLQKGYTPEIINKLHSLSVDIFNNIAGINYFKQLDGLISNSNFKINNLARYIWYIQEFGCDEAEAIDDVNRNLDFVEEPDFESFYTGEIFIVNEFSLTMLVNKNHQLKQDFVPENLVEIPGDYREHSQPLYQEVADAFITMSDACYADCDRRILVYSGYRSYDMEDSLYQTIVAANTSAEEAELEDQVIVDSFAARAGASEHQTGLAIDVLQKGYSHQEFADCKSSDWMNDHAHEYGFILRYPPAKAFITGYYYISYHYRYVGVKPATIMKTYNWTLEEYNLLFN